MTLRATSWWSGLLIACLAVLIATIVRGALEPIGNFYYLPLVPAVMITALLARRAAVLVAIGLSIAANIWLVHRESALDAAANAVLFSLIAWLIAEVCRRLIDALERARALGRNLILREMLLDTILTSVPIVTLDRDGVTCRVTAAAAALLGVDRQVATGRPFHDLLPGFDRATLAKAGQGGEILGPSSAPWTVRPKGDEPRSLTIQANVLPDDIVPERIVLALADQSRAESMRRGERDLQDRLSNVWRLNSMGEMAATLAHELNQPLTAAAVYLHAGQTDIEKLGSASDGAGQTLKLAKAQLLRAGDIIRRMRELISTGARSFTEERASQMIQDLAPVFSLTDVVVAVDMEDTDDEVLADRIQLQQALANLVRNAVDAVADRPDGKVVVTGRSVGPEGYEITVEDNGRGIPADQIDAIFQPMITTKAGGMGLGLSVTRSIVESHGAALVVSRNRHGGASFAFRLPRPIKIDAP